jgi:hypothetical protein
MGSTEDKMQQIIGLLLYGDMTFTLAATHLDLTRQKDKQPRDKMYPLLNLTEEASDRCGQPSSWHLRIKINASVDAPLRDSKCIYIFILGVGRYICR